MSISNRAVGITFQLICTVLWKPLKARHIDVWTTLRLWEISNSEEFIQPTLYLTMTQKENKERIQ